MNTPLPTSAAEAFDALADATAQLRAAEVGEVLAIARAIDVYRIDQAEVEDVFEACASPGGDGSAGVGEFLALEIGAILGVSPRAAICRIADVISVRERFPFLWQTFLQGELRWWQVTEVIHRPGVSRLSPAGARWLDHQLSIAMRTNSWQRVRTRITGWILRADPAAAAEREAGAREDRYVWIDQIQDGHCALYGRLAARDAVDLDHALSVVAATIPAGSGTMSQRRAAAVGLLARQACGQDALPEVTLVVHIDADDPALSDAEESCGVAEIERWGSLLTTQLPEFLKDSKVTVRPVINPWRITPHDGHDPSVALWTAVTALMPVDMFPYGAVPSRSCDIDHTIPHDQDTPGSTRWGNLAPLSRRTHRAKTFGGWLMTQLAPGVIRWKSPAGFEYLVTAWGGTIRLRRPDLTPRNEEPPPPWLDPPEVPVIPDLERDAWERVQYALIT
ncbi:HNH endonuclease [Arachnia propionica]|uniref:HNH endonuclease n=1 Tax=Arachnia propionica TaxID=1750 RepID=A0A3P1T4U1_9ACTN|nr:DUF222 domain-containing protein [Arachnia propionica]RRD04195.1 HNH endonuclease [Arachnia propionica]